MSLESVKGKEIVPGQERGTETLQSRVSGREKLNCEEGVTKGEWEAILVLTHWVHWKIKRVPNNYLNVFSLVP